jgi:ribosomal protein L32E
VSEDASRDRPLCQRCGVNQSTSIDVLEIAEQLWQKNHRAAIEGSRISEGGMLTVYSQIGYGSNRKTRHLMPSGHKAFLVNNSRDVDLLLMHNGTFAAEYVPPKLLPHRADTNP